MKMIPNIRSVLYFDNLNMLNLIVNMLNFQFFWFTFYFIN